jgi:transcriptional regulator with XRE-family HTH domain
MKLAAYLELRNMRDADFAALVGVSVSAVQFWRTGGRMPRKAQMQKIFEATAGAVTPNDFLPFRSGDQCENSLVAAQAHEAQTPEEVSAP